MRYTICGVAYDSNYLEHHGVKGMHWGSSRWWTPDHKLTPEGRKHYGYGARRYQNEDGSLTEEGKRRYSKDADDGSKRGGLSYIVAKSSAKTAQKLAQERRKAVEYAHLSGESEDQIAKKYRQYKDAEDYSEAQRKANIDYMEYRNAQTQGQKFLKGLLFGPIGGSMYDISRSRGNSRAQSFVRAYFPMIGAVANQAELERLYKVKD